MKKNKQILIATAAAAAAGIAFLYARKRKNPSNLITAPTERSRPSHHRTDVFARAKEEAVK